MAPARSPRALWEVATRRWTRRQALVAVAFFVVVGVAGLSLWLPLAVDGFAGAAAAALGIALGNTRD